ncbi:unnamed protein product [Adineta steineri]|uniref:Dynein light chain n=2 Tax=Adineta steineri TaxID=433720 RepID=A0A818TT16_9BILA|nr:unnamed protein product [Adineta steineri]
MTDRKAVIKNADMSEDMQQDAVDIATQALEKYNIEKDIAAYIKKEFDKKYNPTWHCIVGRNFGSYVTHETKHFIYFYLGQVAILLFKSATNISLFIMSSASEFDTNIKLLNEAIMKLKPYYNNHIEKSSMNKTIFVVIIELQALGIYVEKGSINQSNTSPTDNNFDKEVWKALKIIENDATATDIAQSQFNKLFQEYQNEILTFANINQ